MAYNCREPWPTLSEINNSNKKPVVTTKTTGFLFILTGKLGFYYKKDNSTLEEDFFARTKDSLVPIEVKSNSNKSKSLSSLIKNENYHDINFGIKLGDFNVGLANNIYAFPYFCSFLIKEFLKSK